MQQKFAWLFGLLAIALTGCAPDEPSQPAEAEDIRLGGATSVEGSFINIFQQPAANLSAAELDLHRAGDKAFGDIFVTAPSTVNGGLGPVFNQASCENCHLSNGRSPFPQSTNDLRGLLIRLSINGSGPHGEPLPVPGFGGQLQTKAVSGKLPEARLNWQEIQTIEQYLDGGQVTLQKPDFSILDPYTGFPADALISPRIAPPIIGLGLLEAIGESDILALADPADGDGDGISGKPNRVWDSQAQQVALGRFGWKAGQPNLRQQAAAAYNNDMGITNPLFPTETSAGQVQSDGLGDDPEIDAETLGAATFYTQSLAVPVRRNTDDADVVQGRALFLNIQCGSCHHPKFVTGQHPEYNFLSGQTIFPYTDMLLHDMGEGLADNRPEFEAGGREWRTPPLWGIGLTKTVGGHSNFLHDGRARSLEEAILWHGGEAEQSKTRFKALDQQARTQLLKFLESL